MTGFALAAARADEQNTLRPMSSLPLRGLGAALLLLAAALPARAIVIQSFSTTTGFGGSTAPFGTNAGAVWSAQQTTLPITSAVLDLTITGSVTLTEANPYSFGFSWTPQITVGITVNGPAFPSPAVQLTFSGTPQPLAPGKLSTPATVAFSFHVPPQVYTGAALAPYLGTGTAPLVSGVWVTPFESYGSYGGTATSSATFYYLADGETIPVPDGGSGLGLLALAVVGLIGLHRRSG